MPVTREPQLAYSEKMAAMLVETDRRQKGQKILAVLRHFLGAPDLSGLTALDLGCSAGFISDELSAAGARTVGIDIDAPGLRRAKTERGERVMAFVCADGSRLPLSDASVDILTFNHIYEHVVDPRAVVAEIHRVLHPLGVAYLGLANRLGVVEPHYKLPFLSWLPPRLADRYVHASGRADHYYERLETRRRLRQLFAAFTVWDYTFPVLAEPVRFAAEDTVGGAAARLPRAVVQAALPILPAYVWVATKGGREPAGPALREPPRRLH